MKKIKHTFGEVRSFDKEEAIKTRTIQFIISTERKDRHRTVLPVDGWDLKNFNNNGIVGYQHEVYGGFLFDSDPDRVIGKGRAWLEEKQVIGEVTFEPPEINPLAEKIFQKVLFGSLKATSVGFVPTEKGKYGEGKEARGEENETYYYGKRQLVEFSIVNIPSNADALIRSVEDLELKEFEGEELKNKEETEAPVVPDAYTVMKMMLDLTN